MRIRRFFETRFTMRCEMLLGSLVASLLATTFACGGVYVPVPAVPGSTATTVFGIDDRNVVAGAYRDGAGVEHGFFGTLDGNYTSFDYGHNSTGTQARGIAVDGSITGVAAADGFTVGVEFFRKPTGKILTFSLHKRPLDGIVQGINGFDTTVGDYLNADGATTGYYGVAGKYHNDFNLRIKGSLQNSPRGISEDNAVSGFFIDRRGAQHGFVQQDKTVQVIDYPDAHAVATALEDINKAGQAPGQWIDTAGNPHAFLVDTNTGTFTELDPGDGSVFQQAWSVNGRGLVSLSTSNGSSYIFCPRGAKDCPQPGLEMALRQIRVLPETFLHNEPDDSSARILPSARAIAVQGEKQ
jgi:hypothetical protein